MQKGDSVHDNTHGFTALGQASRMVLDGLTLKRRAANAPAIATMVWINAPKKPEKVLTFSGKWGGTPMRGLGRARNMRE
jgi:hypothetical protein